MKGPRFLFCVCGEGGVMRRMLSYWEELNMPGSWAGVLADRPCKALAWAKENGYPTRMVDHSQFSSRAEFEHAWHKAMDEFKADYVLLNYNRILPPAIVKAYPTRILNLHYALLPSFPGLGTARKAVHYGVRIAGVTVHFVDENMDTGPIVAQAALSVNAKDDGPALGRRSFHLAVPLFMQCARWLGEGWITVDGARTHVKAADYTHLPFVPALDADINDWAEKLRMGEIL